MVAGYCSKECQMMDWKTHKKQCKDMLIERVAAAVTRNFAEDPAVPNDIPRQFIVLPPDLTGYSKDVLLMIAIWDFEEIMATHVPRRVFDTVVGCIKLFFEKVKTPGSLVSEEEIADMCTDGTMLFKIGYPGVRLASQMEINSEDGNFALDFASQTQIPRGYQLDPRKMLGAPAHVISMWESAMDEFRRDNGEKDCDKPFWEERPW
ncbi:expressed unknown protein [Seminavis robusta]|uniref:MYND-type domain-containing protein n=1 Tax=Seminavis robusta TaxID=568900 RepID=A0A9N8E6N6_9STRA|nr:expressed unknown protein [Seminavis robusta]|eukprot:Sro731_g194240.1 n/a (206) ;mRNA; f:24338-24955